MSLWLAGYPKTPRFDARFGSFSTAVRDRRRRSLCLDSLARGCALSNAQRNLDDLKVHCRLFRTIENYPSDRGANVAAIAACAAAVGELWLSHFNPSELSRELHRLGFGEVEDLGIVNVSNRYFGIPSGETKGDRGPHIILLDASRETQAPRRLRVNRANWGE